VTGETKVNIVLLYTNWPHCSTNQSTKRRRHRI